MDVADPLLDQERAARLSVTIQSVLSQRSVRRASTSLWAIMAKSSRSEMETEPRVLVAVTRCAVMVDVTG